MKPAQYNEEQPPLAAAREKPEQQQDPAQPNINKNFKLLFFFLKKSSYRGYPQDNII